MTTIVFGTLRARSNRSLLGLPYAILFVNVGCALAQDYLFEGLLHRKLRHKHMLPLLRCQQHTRGLETLQFTQ